MSPEAERATFAWVDDALPRRRATRVYTHHEVELVPRFTKTDVPVPSDPVPCSEDPDEWFSVKGLNKAARLCRWCWMKPECMAYGLAHPELVGVWGGLNQNQRRKNT